MGGMFPPGVGFSSLTNHIEGITGGNVQDFQGLGLDEQEAAMDGVDNATSGMFDSVDAGGDLGDLDRGADAYVGDNVYNVDGSPDYGADAMGDNGGMYDGGYPMGGDWNGANDFDGDGDVDCDCLGDVLSNLLSDD